MDRIAKILIALNTVAVAVLIIGLWGAQAGRGAEFVNIESGTATIFREDGEIVIENPSGGDATPSNEKGLTEIRDNRDGTFTAVWKSDNHRQRCSQMMPLLIQSAKGFCGDRITREIAGWCDESSFCPGGLCNHYGYYMFRCD